ncbi:MAG TPA: type II secretion system F family protein [Acidimicrobiales bacterium]|nr:type II secretion system F family protein [Acidimicrobiales bacterium]
MPIYVIVAAIAVAMSVPVLLYSLVSGRPPGRQVSRNLTAGLTRPGDLRAVVLSQSPVERILQPIMQSLARPARHLSPAGRVLVLQRRIELAGEDWPVERILVLKLVLGGGMLATGLVWVVLSGMSAIGLLAAFCAGLVGYLGPDALLSHLASARQLRISNQLPDTLDQLTICVEAGLSFDAALARTSRSGSGPLAIEISRMMQELRVGVPRADALSNLLERTDVPELRQFVHAVVQAETYGVPISRVLRIQATEQREKRRFRAEERAMKLPVKVIFPLVFCILPTLFIVVLGPAGIQFAEGLK